MGFQPDPVDTELLDCTRAADIPCINRIVEAAGFLPTVVGQVVANQIELETRGHRAAWNANGLLIWDAANNSAVTCTANCAPFSDTVGYFPRNTPGRFPGTGAAKYVVEGVDKLWQPLEEFTDGGYFSRQSHVTPHIGEKVPPLTIAQWKELQDPGYDFKAEADLVVSRLAELAGDATQRKAVDFFDGKLAVRNIIQLATSKLLDTTYEQQMLMINGLSAAEQDATVQAWREKVRHDVVRPTTVIQRWGSDLLYTYSGDKKSRKPAWIAARDFQPYKRVMPHAEYPSGSGCLCSTYAEFTDAFTRYSFGTTVTDVPVTGTTVTGSTIILQDMADLARMCGQSRLWGGMHFSASVADGEWLCSGIGNASAELTQRMEGEMDWSTGYFPAAPGRNPRPTCAS